MVHMDLKSSKSKMLEIKQGPYINKLDKVKFNEIDETKIKIKK